MQFHPHGVFEASWHPWNLEKGRIQNDHWSNMKDSTAYMLAMKGSEKILESAVSAPGCSVAPASSLYLIHFAFLRQSMSHSELEPIGSPDFHAPKDVRMLHTAVLWVRIVWQTAAIPSL